jgi:hypothetical protein
VARVVAARRPAGRVASPIRTLLVPLAAVAAIAAGCGATTRTVTVGTQAQTAPPAALWIYGHATSVERAGGRYLLRFDPAFLATGITANAAAAAAEGRTCRPAACPPVPNDNFTVDRAHENLVFVLPTTAHGTVLTRNGAAGGPFPGTRIDAAQLATLVGNGKAPGLTLFEPLDSGLWLLVHGDTIRSFAQQYRP